jgi:hypothetical protein
MLTSSTGITKLNFVTDSTIAVAVILKSQLQADFAASELIVCSHSQVPCLMGIRLSGSSAIQKQQITIVKAANYFEQSSFV